MRTCERNICLRYWSSCGAREPQESQLVAFQQLRNVYGTATEQLRNSYGTATKQLRNSYGTVTFAHVQLSCLSLLRSQAVIFFKNHNFCRDLNDCDSNAGNDRKIFEISAFCNLLTV